MAKHLVIVESPAKAKTLGKYLGRDYQVKASIAHVVDLPKSKLGVVIEPDLAPEYPVIQGKAKVLNEIKAAAKDKEHIYLAPDPDREGEAIAWHIAQRLGRRRRNVHRVLFNEITKKAVLEALKHPGPIDKNLVDAQQARRILDRLVGYQLSPLLWKKVRRGLSAGRVQSVAVRLLVDREREIQAFVPVEYWTIEADLAKQGRHAKSDQFRANLIERGGKKIELHNQGEAEEVVQALAGAAYRVRDIRHREQTRNPAAPFTTSKIGR